VTRMRYLPERTVRARNLRLRPWMRFRGSDETEGIGHEMRGLMAITF
jgi:hypothetical protein